MRVRGLQTLSSCLACLARCVMQLLLLLLLLEHWSSQRQSPKSQMSNAKKVFNVYCKPLGTQEWDKKPFDNNNRLVTMFSFTKHSKLQIMSTTPLRVWGKISAPFCTSMNVASARRELFEVLSSVDVASSTTSHSMPMSLLLWFQTLSGDLMPMSLPPCTHCQCHCHRHCDARTSHASRRCGCNCSCRCILRSRCI